MSGAHEGQRRVSAWFRPVVPPPRFARTMPTDHTTVPLSRARWAGCPGDGQLHLLSPVAIAAGTSQGYAAALCGQRIPTGALTLSGRSARMCGSCCLAAGMGMGL